MSIFYDISDSSLKKSGEELCGDIVKITKKDGKTIAVLSDGLGSGVKANILATLTAEIVSTMLNSDIPLKEVISTVIATLPSCQTRKIAYSTFSVLVIDEEKNTFKVINMDNPTIFYLHNGDLMYPEIITEDILGKQVSSFEGTLQDGDFLGMISDGILYAGPSKELNFKWGWDQIAEFLEEALSRKSLSANEVVGQLIDKTESLYNGQIGDDATFVGMCVRPRNNLIVFSGPPIDKNTDRKHVRDFLSFDGEKVICGGMTSNLVAEFLDEEIETDMDTLSEEFPPVGKLKGIDLVVEGIVTLAKVIEYLKEPELDISYMREQQNGAALLLVKLLDADHIVLKVGQANNPFYQNPLLPKNISIRVSLIKELAELLRSYRKEVVVKFC